jgi:protein-S-isoprenylcysteine O-methyltransferase Ste14
VNIKGIDKFKEHFPDYPGRKVGIYLVLFTVVLLSVMITHFLGFLVPRLLSPDPVAATWEPVIPFIVSPASQLVGFMIVDSMWAMKDRLLKEDKARAFQRAFVLPVVGIPIVVGVGFHNFIPPYFLVTVVPQNPLTSSLLAPLSGLAFGAADWTMWIRLIVGVYFLVTGFATMGRAMETFGLDYMGLVYLYYPEESKVQDHEIYSVLRHPAYHAIISITLGLFLVYFTTYQLVDLLCIVVGFTVHIRFVEEKELLVRFGESYKEYMRKVPAFIPKQLGIYFKFLTGRI